MSNQASEVLALSRIMAEKMGWTTEFALATLANADPNVTVETSVSGLSKEEAREQMFNGGLEKFTAFARSRPFGSRATARELAEGAGVMFPAKCRAFTYRLKFLGWQETGDKRDGLHLFTRIQKIAA